MLLILSGISISALTNTGIFQKAKEAKQKSENASEKEQSLLYGYEDELSKYTSNDRWDGKVNKPEIMTGMTAIKFTEPTGNTEDTKGKEEKVSDSSKNDWYNYSEKKWANAKTNDGSMWVWIPRYAYKINKSNQTFDVVFLVGTTDNYYDKDGKLNTVLVANRDMTEEKEHEIEQDKNLRNALAAAEHANRAKTVFLNNMSHDIRTPMNAIIGFTALATTHIDNKELVLDYLKKIHISGQHLLSLINDVLDMSRIENGSVRIEYTVVHLPDILHDLNTIIQESVHSKQQELYIDTQDVLHEDIITDKLRLTQVLLNISSNAVKFTPVGGTVNIRVSEKPCRRDGCTTVVFSVKDNGIGMSPEFREQVFDSFTREHTVTENGIGGTGLGMAITKNIVDMLGGTIQVESEVGRGTEFTVMLECEISGTTVKEEPDSEQREPLKNEKQKIRAEIQRRYEGKKVLLVEDNELNREIATAIMEEIGLDVDCVEDGTDAVNIMSSAEGRKYDLIFMDIQMPKMDGYTATREIRTLNDPKCANIPIIAMTANAFEEDRKKAIKAGMNAHIAKPISADIILENLERMR